MFKQNNFYNLCFMTHIQIATTEYQDKFDLAVETRSGQSLDKPQLSIYNTVYNM